VKSLKAVVAHLFEDTLNGLWRADSQDGAIEKLRPINDRGIMALGR